MTRRMSRSAAPYELRVNGFVVSEHRSEAAAWRAWERATRDDDVLVALLVQWQAPLYERCAVIGDHKAE